MGGALTVLPLSHGVIYAEYFWASLQGKQGVPCKRRHLEAGYNIPCISTTINGALTDVQVMCTM